MKWETRTLIVLLAAESYPSSSGSGEMVVMVNTEEARTLAAAGARIRSGSWNLERNTQHYEFGGKTFFWLAGYGGGSTDDGFPVSQDGTRLAAVLQTARELG